MNIGNWKVRRHPQGLDVAWVDPRNGAWITLYPRVDEELPLPGLFYPYMLIEAVLSILALRMEPTHA